MTLRVDFAYVHGSEKHFRSLQEQKEKIEKTSKYYAKIKGEKAKKCFVTVNLRVNFACT